MSVRDLRQNLVVKEIRKETGSHLISLSTAKVELTIGVGIRLEEHLIVGCSCGVDSYCPPDDWHYDEFEQMIVRFEGKL